MTKLVCNIMKQIAQILESQYIIQSGLLPDDCGQIVKMFIILFLLNNCLISVLSEVFELSISFCLFFFFGHS